MLLRTFALLVMVLWLTGTRLTLCYAGEAMLPEETQQGGGPYLQIMAKVVLEDGSPIKSSPIVLLHQPGFESQCADQQLFGNGTLVLHVELGMAGCQISILLTGYRKFTGYVHDGSLITLRRAGLGEGSAVSLQSLSAPAAAREEYERGEALAAKGKWEKAEERFRAAVAAYPQYALAWSELGEALRAQGRLEEAKGVFGKARQADPAYVKPIVQLAAASSSEEHWEEELKFSEEALTMHPVEFPTVYFYRAEAIFHIGSLDNAERLTREAIQLDPGESCPESLVLLANILEKQGKAKEAKEGYKSYLKRAPHGTLAKEAREALSRLKQAN